MVNPGARATCCALGLLLLGAPQQTPRQEFEAYAERIFAGDNPYLGNHPREVLEARLASGELGPTERAQAEARLGKELVQAGELEPAIERLEHALESGVARGVAAQQLRRALALAYLRLAENQNCLERHNADCCIFPFREGGRHTLREPAEKARTLYTRILEAEPRDLESRWLLNVLAMALGEWPDGVEERWRLTPVSLVSQGLAPAFRDVAPELGVDTLSLAGGVAVEDYDGDGWLDILTSSSDPRQSLRFLRNDGQGGFADRSREAGVLDQLGGLNLIAGDVDNDGDPDALVLRGAWQGEEGCIRRSLLQNDGHAVFRDVTRAAGLAEPARPSQTALFADLDGDGWLDLYVGNESRAEEPRSEPGGQAVEASEFPSQLFHNDGQGGFQDVAVASKVTNDRFAKGVAAGDYDNDGDLDLYVSNIGANRLYVNDGQGVFADRAVELGVTEPVGRSFATWFFDHDNDGWLDLMVWGYTARAMDLAAEALRLRSSALPPRLYRNEQGRSFRDIAPQLGLARPFLPMGANFGDVDNDGWLDVYLGTGEPPLQALVPNVLLRNDGGRRYLDVTAASGLGHLQKGHGIAFADFDRDGDQDVFHQLGGFFPVDRFHDALFENPGGGGHWLTLELVGTRSNRDAVGARVELLLEAPGGRRTIHRAAGSVSSFGGSPHHLEIGLGDATRILELRLRWPRTEGVQVFRDPPLDACLRLTEGREAPERLERPGVHLGGGEH